MMMIDPAFTERYLVAVDALADLVFTELLGRGAREDAVDRALAALRRIEGARGSEHAWIFRDPAVLEASENVVEALELRSDGRRDWLHGHLASAVAAVARYDVMAGVVERMGTAAAPDEALLPVETGDA